MHLTNHAHKATLSFILSILKESEEGLHAQGIEARDLVAIFNDYISRLHELEDIAILVANTLKRHEDVHAVRYRVKEPLHLLKKIIRKKQEYPDRHLTTGNYFELINDLVGVRILHLYKDTWYNIGSYIQELWELKREPYAHIKSENALQARQYASSNYRVLINERGYNAQHYILKLKPNRQQYFVEVQVKTLFEEGWSEIDHCIRYPDHEPAELMNRLLWLLNQYTTSADAIASQIHSLAEELQKYRQNSRKKQEVSTAQLRSHINKLPVDEQEKQYLFTCLARLTNQ